MRVLIEKGSGLLNKWDNRQKVVSSVAHINRNYV